MMGKQDNQIQLVILGIDHRLYEPTRSSSEADKKV